MKDNDFTSYRSFLQQYDWNNVVQRVEDIYTTKRLSKAKLKEVSNPLEVSMKKFW